MSTSGGGGGGGEGVGGGEKCGRDRIRIGDKLRRRSKKTTESFIAKDIFHKNLKNV